MRIDVPAVDRDLALTGSLPVTGPRRLVIRRALTALVLSGAGLMAGCQSLPPSLASVFGPRVPADAGPVVNTSPYGDCEAALTQQQELDLFVALQTANEGRLFAALAQLDFLPQSAAVIRYWRADFQRRLNLPEAEAGFNGLLTTCLEGRAKHGLGLVYAQRREYTRSLANLADARRLHPDNAAIRNDYGYVLFMTRAYDMARFELFTAVELENGTNRRTLDNLVMLLLYTQRYDELLTVINRYRISQQDIVALEAELKNFPFATPQ